MRRILYLTWLKLAWFFRRTFGTRAYAIGWWADRVLEPFEFEFSSAKFVFWPPAGRSYCLLPAGIANEPETHQFLARVLRDRLNVSFVDVGASIGEFAIPFAQHPAVARVFAFEPHPVSSDALARSAKLLSRGTLFVRQSAVGSAEGEVHFDARGHAPTSASTIAAETEGSIAVKMCMLDKVLDIPVDSPLMALLDIEGGELEALRGARSTISKHWPLLIIEYNATTRRIFSLEELRTELGSNYTIYRMRSSDGFLDDNLESTWNVVALPSIGVWADLKQSNVCFDRARSKRTETSPI
ncbi:MAG: FkbM family methyltransferase [Xanthomonadales bacterium]|nr:FkbM family methyltransferase [Xanthomonadales bacterium]